MNYTDILKYSTLFVISFIVFYFIYWNIAKNNIIQYYYYSIHNKLFDVFTEKIDYYNIFLVLSFSFIIIIITIVLYWTILYNTAKKKSNCAEILTIIEENAVSKSPYVYTFAIIDKNSIEDKLSYFLLKIRYDFNTRDTKIEYGKDLNGENKLFDKLLLDYDRKLFLRAGDKIDKDNPVFKDNESGKALQKKILSIVNEKITIDNYSEKLPEITQDTLFIEIFAGLGLTESMSEFTDTVDEKIQDIRNDKANLNKIISGHVIVKSWKKFLPTSEEINDHTLGHSHQEYHLSAHAQGERVRERAENERERERLIKEREEEREECNSKCRLTTLNVWQRNACLINCYIEHYPRPGPSSLLPHTHYISDPTHNSKDNHNDEYKVYDDVNIAILTHLGYTDVSEETNPPIDYYKDKLYNNNSYVLIAGEYYVPDDIETNTNNLKNKTLDEINQNLKEIFDFLLDYLGLQLNYPLESVNNYFIMKSKDNSDKKLRYYDLSSMKIKIIDGVNINKIDNDFFKIVSVDKYNKIHKTYTSMKLLDFTRYTANATYEKNGKNEDVELYNSDTIIYNIIYANKNKDKISL